MEKADEGIRRFNDKLGINNMTGDELVEVWIATNNRLNASPPLTKEQIDEFLSKPVPIRNSFYSE